jgi:hypothetical protein
MNMALAETQPELPRIIVGELELIPDACHATWRGKIVRLTTTHMLMVQLLASRQGFAVSYNELHRLRHTEGFHIGDGPRRYAVQRADNDQADTPLFSVRRPDVRPDREPQRVRIQVAGMKRYVTAAYIKHFGVYETAITADSVSESDQPPIKTGLLNAQGVPLYRVPDTIPLGFDLSTQKAKA